MLSYRPFSKPQPYAEQGPIFLHHRACTAHDSDGKTPSMLDSNDYLVRRYDANERIVYGTGAVTPTSDVTLHASDLLDRPDVAMVHVRPASNNCYVCRIERA